jgi:putative DNA primase/helicase
MGNLKNLPAVMRGVQQWVCWGKTQSPDTPKKKPFNPVTGKPADVTDRKTWARFEDCEKAIKNLKYCGAGYIFNGDYIVIDLDCVISNRGEILPEAKEIIEALDSYTEISASGTGVHIICKGNLNITRNKADFQLPSMTVEKYARTVIDEITKRKKRKMPGIEVYTASRYVALTGNVYHGKKIIKDGSHALKEIYNRYMVTTSQKRCTGIVQQKMKTRSEADLTPQEQNLLKIMFNGKNAEKIKMLWSGNFEEYARIYGKADKEDTSQNCADMALCMFLAFYTDKNAEMMDRLFSHSGLYREKWDSKRNCGTYGQYTIQKAIQNFHGETFKAYARRTSQNAPERLETI